MKDPTNTTEQSAFSKLWITRGFPIPLLLVLALCAGCSKPVAISEGYSALIIDQQHNMAAVKGPPMPRPYQLGPGDGVWLDATQFHFTYGTNPITPNMVQLLGNKSAYRLSHPTETNQYVLDRTTIETIKGEPFRGFQSGDQVTVAIGRSKLGADKEEFWVSWAGQILVK